MAETQSATQEARDKTYIQALEDSVNRSLDAIDDVKRAIAALGPSSEYGRADRPGVEVAHQALRQALEKLEQ